MSCGKKVLYFPLATFFPIRVGNNFLFRKENLLTIYWRTLKTCGSKWAYLLLFICFISKGCAGWDLIWYTWKKYRELKNTYRVGLKTLAHLCNKCWHIKYGNFISATILLNSPNSIGNTSRGYMLKAKFSICFQKIGSVFL